MRNNDVCLSVSEMEEEKRSVCVGTHVCFLCICAVCVFVLKEELSKCLVFQCEISADDVASTDYE